MAIATSVNFYDSLEQDRPARAPLAPKDRLKRDAIAVVSQRLLDESPGEEHPRIELARDILLSDALIVAKGEPPYVKDGNEEWVIENDRCTCPGHLEAPSRVCPHRYAFRLYKRAINWAKEQGGQSAVTMPATGAESPFSANVSDKVGTRFMQVTCRTDDSTALQGLLLDANSTLDMVLALRQGELTREPEPIPEPGAAVLPDGRLAVDAPNSPPQGQQPEAVLDKINAFLSDLQHMGPQPAPQVASLGPTSQQSRFSEVLPKAPAPRPTSYQAPEPGAPTCKIHVGRPMKRSQFQNDARFVLWQCTAKDPEGHKGYCNYKVNESVE